MDDDANNRGFPGWRILKELLPKKNPRGPGIGDPVPTDPVPPNRKLLRIRFSSPIFPAKTVVPDGFPGRRAAALDPVPVPPL